MTKYSEAQINAAIEAEVDAWTKGFGVTDSEEIEARRRFHRANLNQNHFGVLTNYLPGINEKHFDAVEFFAQQGKTGYADEIRSIQDEMSIASSDYGYQSEEYIEIKKMMEEKIESIRKEASDRFKDLSTD